jgi:hypothetical protein
LQGKVLYSAVSFTLSTAEAASALRLSPATLARLRAEGVLKAGVHYRAIGAGLKRPPLLWNAEACDAALAQRSRRVLA